MRIPQCETVLKANIPALVETNVEPFNFDTSLIATQYTVYQNDSSLDILSYYDVYKWQLLVSTVWR